MQCVHSQLFQPPGNELGFLDFPPAFIVFLPAKAKEDGEILPHLLTDPFNDFTNESKPVLRVPPVFIITLIGRRREESGQEITVGSVNFDGIEPGGFGEIGRAEE